MVIIVGKKLKTLIAAATLALSPAAAKAQYLVDLHVERYQNTAVTRLEAARNWFFFGRLEEVTNEKSRHNHYNDSNAASIVLGLLGVIIGVFTKNMTEKGYI